MDLKYPKISKQRVNGVCLVAIDYFQKVCAKIYYQKILSFLRHQETYTNTTWIQKDMKMTPSRRED